MAYPPHSPTGNAFAIRFSEMAKPVANAPHSPECRYTECRTTEYRCTKRRHVKCHCIICHFASAKWQSRCIRLSFAIGECGALPLACQWQMANAKCRYTECRTTEYRCTKWRHVKCHCIICHFASEKWQSHCPPSSLVWTRRLSSKHKEKKSPSPNH